MRIFKEIQQELGLKRFISGPLGTMYYIPYTPRQEQVNVRHFDSELPPVFVVAYADLIRAVHHWVEQHPALSRLVWIEQPFEIGQDFIARKHHRYFNNTIEAFLDDEEPIEVPPELYEMHNALHNAVHHVNSPREQIITKVLNQSLVEPSGKTYFDYNINKFVVAEPHLTPEDVIKWSDLMSKPD